MTKDTTPRTDADVIEIFRANGGQVGGPFAGAPLVLLTARGARTGRARTTPLAAVHEEDRIVVFATNAGAEQDPQWLRNVRAHPLVDLEVPGRGGAVERFRAHAVELSPDESARLLDERAEDDPALAGYRDTTARRIPAVALRRADPPDDPRARRRAGEYLLRVHAEMRRDMEALRADLAGSRRGGDPVAPGLAVELARRCRTACQALHDHHTGEDAAFDVFERQLPHLVPVLGRLRTEHRTVAAALERVETLLDDEAGVPDGLVGEYEQLLADMDEHFRHEESALVPALLGARTGR